MLVVELDGIIFVLGEGKLGGIMIVLGVDLGGIMYVFGSRSSWNYAYVGVDLSRIIPMKE